MTFRLRNTHLLHPPVCMKKMKVRQVTMSKTSPKHLRHRRLRHLLEGCHLSSSFISGM